MINTDMRYYDYFTIGANTDEYGQMKMQTDASPAGKVKMAIYPSTQNVQQNILYQNAQYVGLTLDAKVDDTYIIDFNGVRLKVLYASQGRQRAVFMAKVG